MEYLYRTLLRIILKKRLTIPYVPAINQKKAEGIAVGFLEQYHPTNTIESVVMEGGVWIITAKIGLVDQQIRKIIIDGSNGRILSYADRKLVTDNYAIKQAQVTSAVEKALVGIGFPVYENVVQRLYENHRCQLYDCYEHPEYLHEVIKEMFGDNHKDLVESIKTQLKENVEQKEIRDFLTAISK